ncbi:hypothetical protein [Micavibrio aeruginosavorus]|uniref:hypothetical protein n=1 Tax=Micavibrio aeruginosavorus TaxID=349221 RepID=UPI0005A12C12|nr:hypothetical protein [Micavibrio aeruginosavorus]
MKLTIIQTLIIAVVLSGCVTARPPMTDQQIAEVNDAALCSLSNTENDIRIDAEIMSRKLDCDPASLVCAAKGLKKGTSKFAQCRKEKAAENKLQAQKRANPAFGYCFDSGFEIGSQAMATCMAAWSDREQKAKPVHTSCSTRKNSVHCTTY